MVGAMDVPEGAGCRVEGSLRIHRTTREYSYLLLSGASTFSLSDALNPP